MIMTIQEAQKIADKYCTETCKYRKAVYGGIFEGNHLFSLDFQGCGHHGLPIFVLVSSDGVTTRLEDRSPLFYKAWDASHDYLTSSKRTQHL